MSNEVLQCPEDDTIGSEELIVDPDTYYDNPFNQEYPFLYNIQRRISRKTGEDILRQLKEGNILKVTYNIENSLLVDLADKELTFSWYAKIDFETGLICFKLTNQLRREIINQVTKVIS